ncbi:hypothetical protein RZS08_05460, partial [Arthrospira platensis SPKY1]|nr:hypothetical protein [Arthrospira platensis SPKY1]
NWVVKTRRPDSFDDPARELQFLKVGAAEGITPKGFLKGDSLYVRLIDNGLSLREVLEGFSAGLITLVQLEDVIEEVVNAFYILHSRVECCQVDSHSGNTMVYQENNQFKVALIDFGQGEWIDNWEEGINDFYILGSDIQGLAPQVYEFFCELVVELGYPSPDILSNPDSFSG